MSVDRKQRGRAGEALAARFLQRQGMRILARNYRYERGEIDLIAEDGEELVFVEVKLRASKFFGEPEDAVTPKKQRQLRLAAEGYLSAQETDDRPCRFDVVAVYRTGKRTEIKHIRDAF